MIDLNPSNSTGLGKKLAVIILYCLPSKWVMRTDAMGIITRPGRNGGTYAHKDIAFEFASWISAEFKLYLIKEFQCLKEEENERLALG